MQHSKYLWFTDTHFNKASPLTFIKFIIHLIKEKPKGIFLTGDISNGILTYFYLKILAIFINCPTYFVLGNHDYFFSSIEKTHQRIRSVCQDYPNLIWLTEQEPIKINNEVALIGTEGWYDVNLGNPKYLKFTFDWVLTENFRKLPNMLARIKAFRSLANKSCKIIEHKLKSALEQNYKTIYILTHYPPWKEAGRDPDSFFGKYHLAYDINMRLGQTIEKIMKEYPHKNVVVLCGHTHSDAWIHVSHNIECRVNANKYYDGTRNQEHIFI